MTFGATGVELLRSEPRAAPPVTPYTAPECLAGNAPDVRSDIFSLGALLYEMFTGRRAFHGDTAEELAASIENSMPEPIGDTGLDRLVLNCLVKDPAGRWQRLQQVHMEIRILLFAAKRAQPVAIPRQRDFALQSTLREVEAQLNSRLDQQYGEAAAGLRQLSAQLPLLESQLAARLDQQAAETTAALRHLSAELPLLESHLASRLAERHGEAMADVRHLAGELPLVESRLSSRIGQQDSALASVQQATAEQRTVLETVSRSVATVREQFLSLETKLAATHDSVQHAEQAASQFAEMQSELINEMRELGSTVKEHAAAIESMRTSMARTDDFMERVVEALESLQNLVLEQARDRAVA